MKLMKILVINCGSSSLKYQLFLMPEGINLAKGIIEKIGLEDSFLKQENKDNLKYEKKQKVSNHTEAFKLMSELYLIKIWCFTEFKRGKCSWA